MNTRLFPSLLACLVLGGLAAAQIHVPGDYASIQEAIDNASSGDVIVIHGDTHGPILVDKALTFVGDPAPLIVGNDEPAGFLEALAPVTLAGPGRGTVVFAAVNVGGTVNGFLFARAQAGIQGGGFHELHVMDSTIDGPKWTVLIGVAQGEPAIDVDVDSVLVSNSTVRGADSDSDDCYGNGPAGPVGLRAPGADVFVFDATVTGGGSGFICDYSGCPTLGGAGGAGIEASLIWQSASLISGGTGADYWDFSSSPVLCGKAPDGPRTNVGIELILTDDLQATTDLRLGQPWTLSWDKGPCIFAAFQEQRLWPYVLKIGAVFLDLVGPREIAFYGGGPQSHSMPIPNDPSLIGIRVTAQVWETGRGVSRPVKDVVRP